MSARTPKPSSTELLHHITEHTDFLGRVYGTSYFLLSLPDWLVEQLEAAGGECDDEDTHDAEPMTYA